MFTGNLYHHDELYNGITVRRRFISQIHCKKVCTKIATALRLNRSIRFKTFALYGQRMIILCFPDPKSVVSSVVFHTTENFRLAFVRCFLEGGWM